MVQVIGFFLLITAVTILTMQFMYFDSVLEAIRFFVVSEICMVMLILGRYMLTGG